MIRKVEMTDVEVLAKIAKQTFRETFAHDNTEEQLQEYFEEAYSLKTLSTELENPDSEIYFIMHEEEIAGFLKVNWGIAQTERELEDAFEIQRLYVLQKIVFLGLG
ncbi:acetyltransferase (GNAT) domain protein [Streptococcus sp. SK643]|nr:acetyltransferase (GNAT) domain protein [Streptococcus sp. SK643]